MRSNCWGHFFLYYRDSEKREIVGPSHGVGDTTMQNLPMSYQSVYITSCCNIRYGNPRKSTHSNTLCQFSSAMKLFLTRSRELSLTLTFQRQSWSCDRMQMKGSGVQLGNQEISAATEVMVANPLPPCAQSKDQETAISNRQHKDCLSIHYRVLDKNLSFHWSYSVLDYYCSVHLLVTLMQT